MSVPIPPEFLIAPRDMIVRWMAKRDASISSMLALGGQLTIDAPYAVVLETTEGGPNQPLSARRGVVFMLSAHPKKTRLRRYYLGRFDSFTELAAWRVVSSTLGFSVRETQRKGRV